MTIIYASRAISEETYKKLFAHSDNKPGQQAQKYHRLLTDGFIANFISVHCVSALPVTRTNCSKRIIRLVNEEINGKVYHYPMVLNVKILKNIFISIGSFFIVLKLCMKKPDSIIICDVLNISVAAAALLASKVTGKKSIGIVTDVPNVLANDPKKFYVKVNNWIIRGFSSYVFLTEQMNALLNKKSKPYVVVEGQVDINMKEVPNLLSNKHEQKVCLYAGLLDKKYGIDRLVKGFIQADVPNASLHIYGNGDYEQELVSICESHHNIRYFGVVLNEQVVQEEVKAALLINPRPTDAEFTKYSFPSKNMEYMVSGTPVLCTALPGMPKEYNQYVYLIEDERVEGMAKALKEILAKPPEELHDMGNRAKEFVLKNKNNVMQAQKILNMELKYADNI